MGKQTVLVVTPDPGLGQCLVSGLPRDHFEVTEVQPGATFVDAVNSLPSDIAVLDRIEKRSDAVKMEIALLKKRQAGVQIIVVSEHSSAKDAAVIEQGVFFYLAGRAHSEVSFQRELVDLIEAAAERSQKIPDTCKRKK